MFEPFLRMRVGTDVGRDGRIYRSIIVVGVHHPIYVEDAFNGVQYSDFGMIGFAAYHREAHTHENTCTCRPK